MDRRTAILDAARDSFAREGYRATTMEHVARLAGVGKGTIYTFFLAKDVLFEAVLDLAVSALEALVVRTIDDQRPFFEGLHRAVRDVLRASREDPLFRRLAEEAEQFGTPAAARAVAAIDALLLRFIEDQLMLALAHGAIRPCNRRLLAFAILRCHSALIDDWPKQHPPLSDAEIASALDRLFAVGLGTDRFPFDPLTNWVES